MDISKIDLNKHNVVVNYTYTGKETDPSKIPPPPSGLPPALNTPKPAVTTQPKPTTPSPVVTPASVTPASVTPTSRPTTPTAPGEEKEAVDYKKKFGTFVSSIKIPKMPSMPKKGLRKN